MSLTLLLRNTQVVVDSSSKYGWLIHFVLNTLEKTNGMQKIHTPDTSILYRLFCFEVVHSELKQKNGSMKIQNLFSKFLMQKVSQGSADCFLLLKNTFLMYFNLLSCRRQMNAKKKQDHQVW